MSPCGTHLGIFAEGMRRIARSIRRRGSSLAEQREPALAPERNLEALQPPSVAVEPQQEPLALRVNGASAKIGHGPAFSLRVEVEVEHVVPLEIADSRQRERL